MQELENKTTQASRRFQKKSNLPHTMATFKALNDAVIPPSPDLAKKPDLIHSSAPAEHRIDEYQLWTLNHSLLQIILKLVVKVHLAKPTAKMLDKAASQLINDAGHKEPVDPIILNDTGSFAALAPNDRLRALLLLEQTSVSPFSLPLLFVNNPGLVLSVTGTLIMLTTIGYYSGWTGYGSTSLKRPEKRMVEHFPESWKEIGYPGPSKGYHGFRGYLFDDFTE